MKKLMVVALMLMVMLCFGAISFAGNLDDPGLPTSPSSAMYTLEDIYDRLDSNTQATKRSGAFVEPTLAPGSTGHTLDQVYQKAIPTQVPKTGQTPTVPHAAPAGSDGNLQKGVAWPNPRFTGNGDGTVTDNLTGLIWLQDADCFGTRTWANALSDCAALANGACGLTDGSVAGDWRLPNIKEQLSLVAHAFAGPALSNDAGTGKWTSGAGSSFTDVKWVPGSYWTSSACAYSGSGLYAWKVDWYHGRSLDENLKTEPNYVWPVRGGQ